MFCTQCGKATPRSANFCGNCGKPTKEKSTLDTLRIRPTVATTTGQNQEEKTTNTSFSKKPMHLSVYLGMCLGAWILGAVAANIISDMMGSIYAEATAPAVIGFWLGKITLNIKHRGWGGIVAIPIITFIAAIFGSTAGNALAQHHPSGLNFSGPISLAIAFALSFGLFDLLDKNKTK